VQRGLHVLAMSDALTPKRGFKNPRDKFNARRAELADAALQTLAELGYARTSLREIAQHSRFTHGVFHYYFSDKVDLIAYCVKNYKAECVARYDQLIVDAVTYDDFMKKFLTNLAATLRDEAQMHRLWYDLRSQAMFEDSFRAGVKEIDKSLEQMIWRVVSRACELKGTEPGFSSAFFYAMFDGFFQKALLGHLAGDARAVPDMQSEIRNFLVSNMANRD
jgi:AcrR family transcriptional regulator